MNKNMLNENKYVSRVKTIRKDAENLLGIAVHLVGAVGGYELDQMVSGALDAASNLIAFADYFLEDGTVTVDNVRGNYNKLLNATRNLKVAQTLNTNESVNESIEVYIDPYESEYLPQDMLSESIVEDDNLPEELDDDPDAVITLDSDGMPVKFNNDPVELDPFAVKLFRTNSELVDPPEVFDASVGTDTVVVEPEQSDDVQVTQADIEQAIDAVADAEDEDDEKVKIPEPSVELPPDDFDVFANESKVPTAKVTPKKSNVLPPQFSQSDAKKMNESIDSAPRNNLEMLNLLMTDW